MNNWSRHFTITVLSATYFKPSGKLLHLLFHRDIAKGVLPTKSKNNTCIISLSRWLQEISFIDQGSHLSEWHLQLASNKQHCHEQFRLSRHPLNSPSRTWPNNSANPAFHSLFLSLTQSNIILKTSVSSLIVAADPVSWKITSNFSLWYSIQVVDCPDSNDVFTLVLLFSDLS